MKIIVYNVVSLCVFASLYSLERGPVTRSKSKRQMVHEKLCTSSKRACANLLAKENVHGHQVDAPSDFSLPAVSHDQVYTPTSIKVRKRTVKSIAEAIYGPNMPDSLVDEICKDPALMCASPESFTALCHQKFKKLIFKDLEDAGVSISDMQKKLFAAADGIRASAEDYKHLPAASRQVRAGGKQLLAELQNPVHVSFRKATSKKDESYASATGSLVIINENAVGTATISEEQLLWLLAHEIEHISNKDELENDAYKLASKERASKKVKFRDVHSRLSRLQEVFADIGPALRNRRLALGYVKMMEEWCQADGPDTGGDTHPKYGEREDLAHTSVAFLDRHEVEKKRVEALTGISRQEGV